MTTKQEQIKQLIDERTQTYNKSSASILEHLQPSVLTAIDEYFADRGETGDRHALKWEQVGYAEQYNMLVLLGMIQYQVGAQVTTEMGDIVVVTEELAPYFNRVIRVGLPFDMVDESKEKIKEYLQKRDEEKEEQKDSVQFLRNLLKTAAGEDDPEDDEDDLDEDEFDEDDLDEDELDEDDYGGNEFDLDSLTDEQRKRLIVSKQGKPS